MIGNFLPENAEYPAVFLLQISIVHANLAKKGRLHRLARLFNLLISRNQFQIRPS